MGKISDDGWQATIVGRMGWMAIYALHDARPMVNALDYAMRTYRQPVTGISTDDAVADPAAFCSDPVHMAYVIYIIIDRLHRLRPPLP